MPILALPFFLAQPKETNIERGRVQSKEFQVRGIEILAVNIRDLDGAREFMVSRHLGLTSLIDPDGQTAQSYKVGGVPKLVLIGPDGKIRRSAAGWQDERTLREWLADASA